MATTKPRPRRSKSAPESHTEPPMIDGSEQFDPTVVYQVVYCEGDKITYSNRVFVGREVEGYLFPYNHHNCSGIQAKAIPLARLMGGAQLVRAKGGAN